MAEPKSNASKSSENQTPVIDVLAQIIPTNITPLPEKGIHYPDLYEKPIIKFFNSSDAADLSGGVTRKVCFYTATGATLISAYLIYSENTSANEGISIGIGSSLNTDAYYYYVGTSEVNKDQWYVKEVTLLNTVIGAGDAIYLYSAGGKVGIGEINLAIQVQY